MNRGKETYEGADVIDQAKYGDKKFPMGEPEIGQGGEDGLDNVTPMGSLVNEDLDGPAEGGRKRLEKGRTSFSAGLRDAAEALRNGRVDEELFGSLGLSDALAKLEELNIQESDEQRFVVAERLTGWADALESGEMTPEQVNEAMGELN